MHPIHSQKPASPLPSGLTYQNAFTNLAGRKVTYPPKQFSPFSLSIPILISTLYNSIVGGLMVMADKAYAYGTLEHRNDTLVQEDAKKMIIHAEDYWHPDTLMGLTWGSQVAVGMFAGQIALEAAITQWKKIYDCAQKAYAAIVNRKMNDAEAFIKNHHLCFDGSLDEPIALELISEICQSFSSDDFTKLNFPQSLFVKKQAPELFEIHKGNLHDSIRRSWRRLETLLSLNHLQLAHALEQKEHLSFFEKDSSHFLALIYELSEFCLNDSKVMNALVQMIGLSYSDFEKLHTSEEWQHIIKLMHQHKCSIQEARWHHSKSAMPADDDLSFECGSTKIFINGQLLIEASSYFKSMLKGNFKERDGQSISFPQEDFHPKAMETAIAYLKTGYLPLTKNSAETLIEVAKLANYFDMPSLLRETEACLLKCLPLAKQETLDLILAASEELHFSHLLEKIETAYILKFFTPELLPEPFTADFLSKISFAESRNLHACLLILANHFIEKIETYSFEPLEISSTAEFIIDLCNRSHLAFKIVWPSLRNLFVEKPMLIKLLWNGGSSKQTNPKLCKLITKFCQEEDNQHIMLASFNAPPFYNDGNLI